MIWGTPILGNTHVYIYYMLDYMKQCVFGTEPVFFSKSQTFMVCMDWMGGICLFIFAYTVINHFSSISHTIHVLYIYLHVP